jgi:hypothetical protein
LARQRVGSGKPDSARPSSPYQTRGPTCARSGVRASTAVARGMTTVVGSPDISAKANRLGHQRHTNPVERLSGIATLLSSRLQRARSCRREIQKARGIFSGISRPQNARRVNPTPGPASSRLAVGIVVYAAYERRLVDYLRALTVVSYGTFLDAGLHVSSDSIAPC